NSGGGAGVVHPGRRKPPVPLAIGCYALPHGLTSKILLALDSGQAGAPSGNVHLAPDRRRCRLVSYCSPFLRISGSVNRAAVDSVWFLPADVTDLAAVHVAHRRVARQHRVF